MDAPWRSYSIAADFLKNLYQLFDFERIPRPHSRREHGGIGMVFPSLNFFGISELADARF